MLEHFLSNHASIVSREREKVNHDFLDFLFFSFRSFFAEGLARLRDCLYTFGVREPR